MNRWHDNAYMQGLYRFNPRWVYWVWWILSRVCKWEVYSPYGSPWSCQKSTVTGEELNGCYYAWRTSRVTYTVKIPNTILKAIQNASVFFKQIRLMTERSKNKEQYLVLLPTPVIPKYLWYWTILFIPPMTVPSNPLSPEQQHTTKVTKYIYNKKNRVFASEFNASQSPNRHRSPPNKIRRRAPE